MGIVDAVTFDENENFEIYNFVSWSFKCRIDRKAHILVKTLFAENMVN